MFGDKDMNFDLELEKFGIYTGGGIESQGG